MDEPPVSQTTIASHHLALRVAASVASLGFVPLTVLFVRWGEWFWSGETTAAAAIAAVISALVMARLNWLIWRPRNERGEFSTTTEHPGEPVKRPASALGFVLTTLGFVVLLAVPIGAVAFALLYSCAWSSACGTSEVVLVLVVGSTLVLGGAAGIARQIWRAKPPRRMAVQRSSELYERVRYLLWAAVATLLATSALIKHLLSDFRPMETLSIGALAWAVALTYIGLWWESRRIRRLERRLLFRALLVILPALAGLAVVLGHTADEAEPAWPITDPPRGYWVSHSDVDHVRDLTVDASGYVWAVGSAGATRWDTATGGHERHSQQDGLTIVDLYSVSASVDGGVWVAGPGGVAGFDGASWSIFKSGSDMPNITPFQVAVGADDTVAATGSNGAAMYRDGSWIETTLPGYTSGESRPAVVDVASNGAVWIVTSQGVVRWDGTTAPEIMLPGQFQGVSVGSDGTVYVVGDGLQRYDGESWSAISGPYGRGIDIGSDGAIWIAAGIVHRYEDGTWESMSGGRNTDSYHADVVAADDLGGAWVAKQTGPGLWYATDAEWEPLIANNPGCLPQIVAPASDGSAYGLCQETSGERFWYFDGVAWTPVPQLSADSFNPKLITFDGDDNLWGVSDHGLARWGNDRWHVDGATWPFVGVTALAVDSDGSVWVGGYLPGALEEENPGAHVAVRDDAGWLSSTLDWSAWPGLTDRYEPSELPNGLPFIWDIAPAYDGSLWIATSAGVFRYTDGVVEPRAYYGYEGFDAWPGSYAIAVGPTGEIWVAMEDHVAMTDGDTWVLHEIADIGWSGGEPRAITFAPDGSVWVGATRGAARFDGSHWMLFDQTSGLGMSIVEWLVGAPNGTLWFSSGGRLTQLVLDPAGPLLSGAPAESWPPPSTTIHPGRDGGHDPTIELADIEPPQITVLPPGPRVVAGYTPFRFSGVAEPDATIYVDELRGEVAADGQFEVWVPLTEGSQVVIFEAVDPAGNSAKASRDVEFDPSLLALHPGGIGAVSFGEEALVSTNRLTELLGPPSWVKEESTANNVLPFGYGARNLVRVVGWDGVGLSVVFADADYFRTDGMLHLVAWNLSGGAPASLRTPSGISVESSLDELKRQHPDELWIAPDFEECSGGWPVWIGDRDTSNAIQLTYKLDPSTPGATPAGLHAGAGGTC